ncbi:MAG: hypothetical protein LBJ31_07045 [Treponema sp.]|jgi:hypothetical protein|nr:hypothetical protein [Treponema sp.]
MKNIKKGMVILLVFASSALFGQYSVLRGPSAGSSYTLPANLNFTAQRSAHYEALVPDGVDGALLLAEMEQRFEVYNRLFRFDPDTLQSALRVRVFTNPRQYRDYVESKLGVSRDGAVYLHYNSAENRELVVLKGSGESAPVFSHQAFIQFLRGFVNQSPAWIREGFAVYFSTLVYNETEGRLEYEENLSWLDTVKRAGPANPETILLADRRPGIPANFQGLSWALVSFFLENGDLDYFRTLTDSFMVLDPAASALKNSEAVYQRLIRFTNLTSLSRAWQAYIAQKRTFTELVDQGQKNYSEGNLVAAEADFTAAGKIKSGHYAPLYYLALIAYDRNDYAGAEALYKRALDAGAERALVQYARGVNASAQGDPASAKAFLEEAARLAPALYRARADDLIRRLE